MVWAQAGLSESPTIRPTFSPVKAELEVLPGKPGGNPAASALCGRKGRKAFEAGREIGDTYGTPDTEHVFGPGN